jgi:transcriptional regulator with XRE-family HTH domain
MVKKNTKATGKAKLPEAIPGQADRLKRLRLALGFTTSTDFAAFLGVSVQRYNAFEHGEPLSRQVAFLLVQKISGLSLDWLYFGRTEALPLQLARRLGELGPSSGEGTNG